MFSTKLPKKTTNHSHAFYVPNRHLTGKTIETVPGNLDLITEILEKNKHSYVIVKGKKRRIQTIDNAKKALRFYQSSQIEDTQIEDKRLSQKRKNQEKKKQSLPSLPTPKKPMLITQTPSILIPPLIPTPTIVVAEKKQKVCEEQNQSPMGQVVLDKEKDILSRLKNIYVPFDGDSSRWGFRLFNDPRILDVQEVLEEARPVFFSNNTRAKK